MHTVLKTGRRRLVELIRPKAPRMVTRLIDDALDEQTVIVPGHRHTRHRQRARETDYNPAVRQLGNRLVSILHGCLKTRTHYDEATA